MAYKFLKRVLTNLFFDLSAFLAANLVWLLAIFVALFYLDFYLSAWYRYSRDPEPGVIIVRFQPPKNLSPAAAVHYIDNEAADDKTLTAGLLSLAVKRSHHHHSVKKTIPNQKTKNQEDEQVIQG